jgi:hypothetical protein
MTAVKMAFGYGFPKSSSGGWFCSLALYSAEATAPQTVMVSPMSPVASCRLSAAVIEKGRYQSTAEATSSFVRFILSSNNLATTRVSSRQKVVRFQEHDQFCGPFPILLHVPGISEGTAFASA